MSKTIRWGVLGNANIARVCVIPAIQKSRNGRVKALATRTPDKAAEVIKKNHIEQVYGRYEEILDDPEIDAVYIPLPNHLHKPWALRSLEAGKHVLCEKPLACNAKEAEEMANKAVDSGLLLMEAFMYRFHPRSQRIRQMAADGKLGILRLIRTAFCFQFPDKLLESGDAYRLKPEMGGGALLDVGCYGVSVARWILNQEPIRVQAQANYHEQGVDLQFVGSMQFPDESMATLEASFISALQQTYTVVGSKGAIDLPHDAFVPWEKDAIYTFRKGDQESGKVEVTPGTDEYQLMVEHFSDAISGQSNLAYSPEDSISNMRVLDALAKAAKTGKTIYL